MASRMVCYGYYTDKEDQQALLTNVLYMLDGTTDSPGDVEFIY